MHPHKSDDDSLTKSLDKSSPCDELDFRKGSLNDDDLSFEHSSKLHKYAKSGLQSSDSEFVLSMDGGKSMKTKQPHLVCAKIYHEFDSTSNLSLLCGGARQVSGWVLFRWEQFSGGCDRFGAADGRPLMDIVLWIIIHASHIG